MRESVEAKYNRLIDKAVNLVVTGMTIDDLDAFQEILDSGDEGFLIALSEKLHELRPDIFEAPPHR